MLHTIFVQEELADFVARPAIQCIEVNLRKEVVNVWFEFFHESFNPLADIGKKIYLFL